MLNSHVLRVLHKAKKQVRRTSRSRFALFLEELLSDSELFDDGAVAVDILLGEVVKKVSSVTNHLQKTTARMMVILVGL